MKSVLLKMLFIIVTASTYASTVVSCPTTDDREQLNFWVCDLGSEMTKRDREADYTREAKLLNSTPEIKKIRAALSIFDNETCRNFNQSSLVTAFQRILQHQSIPRSIMKQRSESAAAVILSESTSDKVEVCESQHLETKGQDHTYQNLYYFKFGPVREHKHFLIRVTTKWQH